MRIDLTNLWSWCRRAWPIAAAVWAFAGPVAGWFASDFLKYSESSTAVTKSALQDAASVTEEIPPILRRFSAVALGEGQPKQEDKDALAASIQKALNKANWAAMRVPDLRSQYQEFADALVDLQEAADEMTGPLDAKPFVKAVARYEVAKQAFAQSLNDIQSGYLKSLVRRL